MSSSHASLDPICEEVADLIAAYALGAADPDERRLVEAYLTRCPKAQAMLEVYQEISANLLFSTPPRQAPPRIREQLQAAIAQTTIPDRGAARDADQGWWRRFGAQVATIWRWSAVPVVLALLLLGIFGFAYVNQELEDLRQVNATLRQTLEDQSALLAQQTEVLVLLGAGNARRIELPAADGDPGLLAAVLYDPERTEMFLYVEHFPSLPPDQVYQVWLIQGETRISAGTFKVDYEGNGILFIHTSEPVQSFEAMGITPEPIGGSPGPTSPPVVRGAL